MSVPTLIVTPEELGGSAVTVRGAVHSHLFRARRLAVGDAVRLVDGQGRAVSARVARVSKQSADLVVGEVVSSNESRLELEIWAALPRPQRAAWLVEKATELGVASVRWLDSARSGRRPTGPGLERLSRVARAAVEQCGRSRVPAITGPHDWDEVLQRAGSLPSWLLDPAASRNLDHADVGPSMLLVGPEGGFTVAEVSQLDEAGAGHFGLGARVLRVETAAVAGAAILLARQRHTTS